VQFVARPANVELSTKTKIFCGCTTQFGGDPNTHCCPICIGLPGTLPKLNRQVVRYAVMAGLASSTWVSKPATISYFIICKPPYSFTPKSEALNASGTAVSY